MSDRNQIFLKDLVFYGSNSRSPNSILAAIHKVLRKLLQHPKLNLKFKYKYNHPKPLLQFATFKHNPYTLNITSDIHYSVKKTRCSDQTCNLVFQRCEIHQCMLSGTVESGTGTGGGDGAGDQTQSQDTSGGAKPTLTS